MRNYVHGIKKKVLKSVRHMDHTQLCNSIKEANESQECTATKKRTITLIDDTKSAKIKVVVRFRPKTKLEEDLIN